MTDERKPAKPGMEEVSPKFVDEAEAAVEAAATRKAHDAIEAVLAKVPPQGEDETQIESGYRKLLALREYGPPRGSTEQNVAAWIDSHDGLEEGIGTLRAENLRDVETKLAVICDRIKLNLGPGEQPDSADLIIAQSAQDDLRRIAEESGAVKVAQELASTEHERITALWDAYKETGAVLVERDGEHQESGTADADDALTEAMGADKAAWGALVNERCHTLGGLLVKMSAFKSAVAESDFEGPPEVLFDTIVRDLERMSGGAVAVVPEAPAAPDAASAQRSPLFSRIFDMETPLTDAEGAVEALWLLVEDGKLCPDAAEPIAYLVTHLNGHIQEQRRLFDELFVAAGGSAA